MTSILRKHIFNQLLSAITAFLTLLLSGIWLGWVSAVLPKFKAGQIPISMTSDEITWMVAFMDLGNFFSPIPTGYLMDRFGRLFTIRLAMVFFILTSELALWATTPYHLYLARILAGMGKGIGFTAATVYVAEIAGPKIRGALSGIFIVMLTGGTLVSMTFGPYISFESLNRTTLVFPIVGLILTFFIVESPYYFLVRRNEASATNAFSRIRDAGKSADNNAELAVIREKVEKDMSGQKNLSNLISERGNRRALTIILVTGALERAGGISCILAYASTTLPADHFWTPSISVIIFSWSTVIAGFLGMGLVDRFGRKPLQLISTLGLTLLTGISAVFYYFYQKTNTNVSQFTFIPHIGVILYGIFYPIGTGQIPHTFQSELFPTSVKSQASAIMTMALAISSFITNKIYFAVDHSVGVYFMYAIFAFSNFASMIFTIFYVFETKGKTLEEIQDLLNGQRS